MATDAIDKTKLKDMIDHFYRFGGSPGWDGDINEATAEVFGMILREAYKCTDAVKLLPTPPGGKPSILWLVMQFGNITHRLTKDGISRICASGVIRQWDGELDRAAALGFSSGDTSWH